MTEFRQAAAGPSRPRRKPVAENWDEDFDFDLNIGTSTRSKAASDAQVQRTSHDIKVAVAGSDQRVAHAARASERLRKGKSKDEEQEDWDEDWDSPAQADKGMTRQPIGDSGHSTRALGVDHSSSSGGIASRRTTQNPAPLNLQPISPPRTSSVPSVPVPLRSQVPQSHAFSRSSERNAPSAWTSIPAPSTSGYPQPQSAVYPSTAIPTDSTSSFGSAWSAHSGGTPTRSTTSVTSPSTNAKRVLRHMKSGDMMPPPPLPGSGSPAVSKGVGSSLIRRVSEKRKSVGKSISIDQEQAQLASPSGTTGGKPGFWRRLSSQNVPESPQEAEGRRNRSSSVGSPTKQRFDDTPPLPPLPPNLRSASNASNASNASQHSGSSSVSVARSYTSTGLASILRRSSSNLAKKVKGRGGSSEVPPTPSMQSGRIPSGSSAISSHSLQSVHSAHSGQSRVSRTSSQQSFSRGYHLPSPSPQSPHVGTAFQSIRPSVHQSQSYSTTPPLEPAPASPGDDTQTTPKKRRPVSVVPPRSSGWTGDAWTGFPPRLPKSSRSPRTGVSSWSPVKARPALGVASAGQPKTPTTPRPPMSGSVDDDKGQSTFKKLQSLSRKHGRRLSGGWKFGTNSSTSSGEGDKRAVSKLETVKGSPSKTGRGEEHGYEPSSVDPDTTSSTDWDTGASEQGDVAIAPPPSSGPVKRTGSAFQASIGAPSPSILSDKFDQHVDYLPRSGSQRLRVKEDKERRRQSWNDFVIPRNVLEKQKELKEGIRGVRKFASGVEALKTLLSTHAAIEARVFAADDNTKRSFNLLEDEFDQWWEMATVLIEVGNTGQGMSGSAASVSPLPSNPSSPKRNRRITLASQEAKAASSMLRRAQTDYPPLSPSFNLHSPRLGSPRIAEKPEGRKASLPDPAEVTFGPMSGPPRASPDLWHGSTGRHELSKRQLEVLRTMLQTPISDAGSSTASVPVRPNMPRGLSGSSTVSSSMSGMSGLRKSHVGHSSAMSVSRGGEVQTASPMTRLASQQSTKGPESFPSPGESTYITPSDSMPSPLTASILANAQRGQDVKLMTEQQRQALKMRKGSKVGLAGLREFLKGLKGKDSSRDLTEAQQGTTAADRRTSVQQVGRRASRLSISGVKGRTLASPPGTPTPGSQWPRPGVSQTAGLAPTPSAGVSLSRTTTGESDYGQGVSRSDVISKSASRNDVGPPVTGKDRRRPGLRGIFRGGSGNWGDLVSGSKTPNTPDEAAPISAQLERMHVSGNKRTSITSVRPGVHPNPRQSSDPIRRESRIVSDVPSYRSAPTDVLLNSHPAPTELGVRPRDPQINTVNLGDEGEMTVRPRKSRVLGLGWPEDVPRLGQDRIDSTASGFSFASDDNNDQNRHSSAPAAGQRVTSDETAYARASGESNMPGMGTGMIALTPENLPVLLEYLRQCEGKLGEWRKKVEGLDLGVKGE